MVKHSVSIAGHRTSITLEAPFWEELNAIARAQKKSLAALIGEIDAERAGGPGGNLSSALRVFVLQNAKKF